MKKLLAILLLFTSFLSYSQVKVDATGNIIPTGIYPAINSTDIKGTLHSFQTIAERNALPLNYRDTGMVAYVASENLYYSLIGGIANSNWTLFGQSVIRDGRIDGGYVTWSGTGLTFDVTALTYSKNGVIYTIPSGQVTLDQSDDTYSRVDLIVADTVTNTFLKSTGTAGVVPLVPQATRDQIALTTGILLNANDVVPPTVSRLVIYDENNSPPEWAVSGGSLTYNKDDASMPFRGFKNILVTSYNPTYASLSFTGASQSVNTDKTVKFRIKLNDTLKATSSISLFLYNGSKFVAFTGRIRSGFGFRFDNIVDYQNVSIPFSSFPSFADTTFNKIYIEFKSEGDTSRVAIDVVEIQNGITNTPPQTDYSNKVDSVTKIGNDSYWWAKGIPHFIGSGGSGVSGCPVTFYTTADSLYYVRDSCGILDSTQWVGSGGSPSQFNPIAGTNVTLSGIYPNIIFNSSGGVSSVNWGSIAGTLSSQTDLQNALNLKLNKSDSTLPNRITANTTNISSNTTAIAGKVSTVTGLSTDNTDPVNPIVKVSVDGSSITGLGTPASPLVSVSYGWGIAGNTGITAFSNFLGTKDLKSLWIRTNNIPRIVIDSTRGRVWIKSQVYQPLTIDGTDYAFKVTDSVGSNLLSISETGGLNIGSINSVNVPLSGKINLLSSQFSEINFFGGNVLNQRLGLASYGNRSGLLIGSNSLFSENTTSSVSIGKKITSPVSAVLNIESINRGFLPPRLTTAQRDLVNNGISAGTFNGGSGYINGIFKNVITGGSGYGVLGQATVTGGVVTSFLIIEQGVGYKVGDVLTMFIPTGGGFSYTVTSVIAPVAGTTLFCTDCTATDSSTGVMQTYNGTTWKNNW